VAQEAGLAQRRDDAPAAPVDVAAVEEVRQGALGEAFRFAPKLGVAGLEEGPAEKAHVRHRC
jgi:hypothetical protein